MIQYNNTLSFDDNYTFIKNFKGCNLKDFKYDDYTGTFTEYIKDVFSILAYVDMVIESLFTEITHTYKIRIALIEERLKSVNRYFIICNTVYTRLMNEFGINEECIYFSVNESPYNSIEFEFTLAYFDNKDKYYNIGPIIPYKQTGRTTRIINNSLQNAFNMPGSKIPIRDHFTYEMIFNDNRYRGMNIPSYTQADNELMRKLRQRIERELPENVLKCIIIQNKNILIIDYPIIYKVNYQLFFE